MTILPRTSGIYRILCTVNNKSYIGSAYDLYRRWNNHRSTLRKGTHCNRHLQNAWNKYGVDTFAFEILELCDVDVLLEREQHYIDTWQPFGAYGFNIVVDAKRPMEGRKHSDEARIRMSIAQKGIGKGIPLSDETKRKLSIANTGRVFSPEHRAKMSIANTGRYYSLETRAKIAIGASKAQKGRAKTPEHRAKIALANVGKVISQETRDKISAANTGNSHPHTAQSKAKIAIAHTKSYIVTSPDGIVYDVYGLTKFCKEHRLLVSSMSSVASGQRSHHKGWRCRHSD